MRMSTTFCHATAAAVIVAPVPNPVYVPNPVPVQLAAAPAPVPSTPTVVGSGGLRVVTSNPISISNPIDGECLLHALRPSP